MYAADQVIEDASKKIFVDEFALRKGHNYATSVLNADTGRILAIVLKSTLKPQAKRRLKEWFKRYQFHKSGAVSKIAKTLIAREQALLETIVSPLSNGIMESTNNKIKLINRRGFGYRNDAHLLLLLRLETGH